MHSWEKSAEVDPRDIRILIKLPLIDVNALSKQQLPNEIRNWLVDVYQKITSDCFLRYLKDELQQSEIKTLAAKNILLNIQDLMMAAKIKYKLNEQQQAKLFYLIEQESKCIIDRVITKYPQSVSNQSVRKLKLTIRQRQIDVRESDQFDNLRNSEFKAKFQLKNGKQDNYYSQIMKTINYITEFVTKPLHSKSYTTNFQGFQKLMEFIFSYANHNNQQFLELVKKYELAEPLKKSQAFDKMFDFDLKNLQEVKKLNHPYFRMGHKIQSNVNLYKEQHINEGVISVSDVSILRVLTKWVEQLEDKILKPEENILKKLQAFKNNDKSFVYLSTKQKASLKKYCESHKQAISQAKETLKNHATNLLSKLSTLKSGVYKNQADANLQKFAANIQASIANYTLTYLNELITKIIKIPINAYNQFAAKGEQDAKLREQIKTIDLVTLKIGDLMRCKCKANQNHIINIFNLLLEIQKICPKLLRVIRVKNRLDKKDNDLLINIFFMDKIQCQIQLQVTKDQAQTKQKLKQEKTNSFNHLLYQLKRADFGPIAECGCIVAQYDPSVKDLIKNGQPKKPQIKSYEFKRIDTRKPYAKSLPFFCSKCSKFKKQVNYRFYEKAIQESFCKECYQQAIIKKDLQQLIRQLFRHRYSQSQIKTIANHVELANFKNKNLGQFVLNSEQGFIIDKNKSKPYPYYCKFQTNKTKVYALTLDQNDINFNENFDQEAQAKLIYQGQESLKETQIKNILIFTVKNPNKFIIKKKNEKGSAQQYKLSCQCCQQKNIYLRTEYKFSFSKLTQNQNKKTIKNALKKRSTTLILTQRQVKKEVNNIDQKNQIKNLYLNGNKQLDKDFLNNFSKLVNLNISQCQISDLKTIKFDKLQKLQQLRLSYNNIKVINGLESLQHLKTLYLDHNQIKTIQNLGSLQKLKQLHLQGNNIERVQQLKELKQLQKLQLQFNSINSVQGLQKLEKLSYLNISGNQLSQDQLIKIMHNVAAQQINIKGKNFDNKKKKNIDQLKKIRDSGKIIIA